MRKALAVAVVLAGCGSSVDVPDDQKLHDLSSDSSDTLRIRYGGKQVPLADIPGISDQLGGLPVSGIADVAIDISVPKVKGRPDFAKANGSIAVSCASCQLGNDNKKLDIAGPFGPVEGGIYFGHVSIGSFDTAIAIDAGKVKMTSWKFASPDIDLQLGLEMQLATDPSESTIDGCIKFKPTKDLQKRDPKTHDVLSLTGASLQEDGMFHIKIEGSPSAMKRLSKPCKT